MLSAIYTHKSSAWRNLASRSVGLVPEEETISSGHTFYQNGAEVARLNNYVSGPSQIEVYGERLVLKRQKFFVLFTQYYTLERDGRLVARAKRTKLLIGSNSRITYGVEGQTRELKLKSNFRSLTGTQYLLLDGQDRVGVIDHNNDFGAEIDFPPEIPLEVQIFIYHIAFIMHHR